MRKSLATAVRRLDASTCRIGVARDLGVEEAPYLGQRPSRPFSHGFRLYEEGPLPRAVAPGKTTVAERVSNIFQQNLSNCK
jgi:hypothetical protein